jgi:hypothetical protein
MPKIEVEEAEWNARGQLTGTIQKLLSNPKSRPLLLKAQREAFPETPIPEIDAATPILDEVSKVRKDFDEWKAAQEKKEQEREAADKINAFASEWTRQKGRVRERYPDFTDSAIDEIEKFATEKGIPDFEAAAARYRELNPPATVEAPHSGGWGFFDESSNESLKDQMEKLMVAKGDNEAVTNKMVNDALTEIRGGRRAA